VLHSLEKLMDKAQGYPRGDGDVDVDGVRVDIGESGAEKGFGGSGSYRLYSGLLVLLKMRVRVSYEDMRDPGECSLPLTPSANAPSHV